MDKTSCQAKAIKDMTDSEKHQRYLEIKDKEKQGFKDRHPKELFDRNGTPRLKRGTKIKWISNK